MKPKQKNFSKSIPKMLAVTSVSIMLQLKKSHILTVLSRNYWATHLKENVIISSAAKYLLTKYVAYWPAF
jgi:hypothetical protein